MDNTKSLWTEHISTKYNATYWFNKETGKSVWVKPDELKDIDSNNNKNETIVENKNQVESSSGTRKRSREQDIETIDRIIKQEDSEASFNAPTCPRLISVVNIPQLISTLRMEKPKIQSSNGSLHPDVDIIFNLDGVDTSLITRAFQEDQMLKTQLKLKKNNKVIDLPSFWEVWSRNGDLARTILSSKDCHEAKWKNQKTFGYKLATNFMPGYAKALYEYFHAESVLDPCAGWGDRLVGAVSANDPVLQNYVAFDPNFNLRPGYVKQMKAFGHSVKDISKERIVFSNGFTIYSLPFEEGAVHLQSESFDLVFTSPPFFDYEMYNPENPQYSNWIQQFYIPLMKESCRCVRQGGHVAIYVGDTSAGEIDDFMRITVPKILPSLVPLKQVAFRGMASDKIRGIWVYKKN